MFNAGDVCTNVVVNSVGSRKAGANLTSLHLNTYKKSAGIVSGYCFKSCFDTFKDIVKHEIMI
jgi:hypothetical protein